MIDFFDSPGEGPGTLSICLTLPGEGPGVESIRLTLPWRGPGIESIFSSRSGRGEWGGAGSSRFVGGVRGWLGWLLRGVVRTGVVRTVRDLTVENLPKNKSLVSPSQIRGAKNNTFPNLGRAPPSSAAPVAPPRPSVSPAPRGFRSSKYFAPF